MSIKDILVTLAIVMAVCTGAYAAFDDQIRPKNLGTVTDGAIYRSGQIDRRLIGSVLEDKEIQRVILLTGYVPEDPDHVVEVRYIDHRGIEKHRFPMSGSGVGTPLQYAQVVALLKDSADHHVPTLIHCAAGAQRTGGTVAAYRMLIEGKTPSQAYDEALRYGWDPHEDTAWPDFLNANMTTIARHLVELGALSEMPTRLPVYGKDDLYLTLQQEEAAASPATVSESAQDIFRT